MAKKACLWGTVAVGCMPSGSRKYFYKAGFVGVPTAFPNVMVVRVTIVWGLFYSVDYSCECRRRCVSGRQTPPTCQWRSGTRVGQKRSDGRCRRVVCLRGFFAVAAPPSQNQRIVRGTVAVVVVPHEKLALRLLFLRSPLAVLIRCFDK